MMSTLRRMTRKGAVVALVASFVTTVDDGEEVDGWMDGDCSVTKYLSVHEHLVYDYHS